MPTPRGESDCRHYSDTCAVRAAKFRAGDRLFVHNDKHRGRGSGQILRCRLKEKPGPGQAAKAMGSSLAPDLQRGNKAFCAETGFQRRNFFSAKISSAQKFDADLRLGSPDHTAAAAGAEIQGHVDVKKVGDCFRGLDHEAGAIFGFVPNRAFAQLLANRVYKPAATTHQRALTAACVRLNLRMICVGHVRPPTALNECRRSGMLAEPLHPKP
jgi:hypothetical protein